MKSVLSFIRKNTWLHGGGHGWGNGYVVVHKSHPLYGLDEGEVDPKIPYIHGGITFSSPLKKIEWDIFPVVENPEEWWVYGFDTAHLTDSLEVWTREKVSEETKMLKKYFEKFSLEGEPVLINVSNHPSEKWSNDQKERWKKIIDIPFPNVDPEFSTEKVILECVFPLYNQIKDLVKNGGVNQLNIMLMGEFTVVHILSKMLAGTLDNIAFWFPATKREVFEKIDESGNTVKQVVFKFIQWRHFG